MHCQVSARTRLNVKARSGQHYRSAPAELRNKNLPAKTTPCRPAHVVHRPKQPVQVLQHKKAAQTIQVCPPYGKTLEPYQWECISTAQAFDSVNLLDHALVKDPTVDIQLWTAALLISVAHGYSSMVQHAPMQDVELVIPSTAQIQDMILTCAAVLGAMLAPLLQGKKQGGAINLLEDPPTVPVLPTSLDTAVATPHEDPAMCLTQTETETPTLSDASGSTVLLMQPVPPPSSVTRDTSAGAPAMSPNIAQSQTLTTCNETATIVAEAPAPSKFWQRPNQGGLPVDPERAARKEARKKEIEAMKAGRAEVSLQLSPWEVNNVLSTISTGAMSEGADAMAAKQARKEVYRREGEALRAARRAAGVILLCDVQASPLEVEAFRRTGVWNTSIFTGVPGYESLTSGLWAIASQESELDPNMTIADAIAEFEDSSFRARQEMMMALARAAKKMEDKARLEAALCSACLLLLCPPASVAATL